VFTAVAREKKYARDADTVLCQHYGIVFKPREKFMPVVDSWLHTFAFSLPGTLNSPTTPNYNTHSVLSHPVLLPIAQHTQPVMVSQPLIVSQPLMLTAVLYQS